MFNFHVRLKSDLTYRKATTLSITIITRHLAYKHSMGRVVYAERHYKAQNYQCYSASTEATIVQNFV